jgi:hypothetical protein
MGVGGQYVPTALPLGETRYPLYRVLGGPQNRSERVRKRFAPQWDSIPVPTNPWRVTIPTELSRPTYVTPRYLIIFFLYLLYISLTEEHLE